MPELKEDWFINRIPVLWDKDEYDAIEYDYELAKNTKRYLKMYAANSNFKLTQLGE